MVRARIRMFGSRLVVVLGRKSAAPRARVLRPTLSTPTHVGGTAMITQAIGSLTTDTAQRWTSAQAPVGPQRG